jgi:hypothetical protein
MIPQRFQVVIIGGGSAGTAAAVASASRGMHTLLIEKKPYGGGNATAAEVGTICGLFHQNKQEADWLVKGYAKYFAERLDEDPLIHSTTNLHGIHFLPYRIKDFKDLVVDELQNAKVEVWWNATICSITTEKNSLHLANIEKNGTIVPIAFDAIVDCTGNASICEMIQHTMIQENEYQASARVFTIEGMDPDDEQVVQLIIWRALTKAIRNGILPETYNHIYPIQGSFVNGKGSFKLSIPIPVTHKSGNIKELKSYSEEAIEQIFHYLKNEVPAFHNATLVSIADEVGIRTGPRPKGDEILTGKHVLEAIKCKDTIARSAWPIEEWTLDQKVIMKHVPEKDYYDIPVGCLTSPEFRNLFFAGRAISADREAIASARVMGVCLQTGYAAGILAASLAKGEDLSKALDLIQKKQILY